MINSRIVLFREDITGTKGGYYRNKGRILQEQRPELKIKLP
jgi:hypothetical protein